MKKSEVLRRAQKYLVKEETTEFVCVAIRFCRGGTRDQKRELRAWVQAMLYVGTVRHIVLESWIEDTTRIRTAYLNPKKMRAYRMRYIDHLIEIVKDWP